MTNQSAAAGFPLDRGVQLTKEVSYLNMREAAAASSLSQLWSDTFLTNAGISAGDSSNYSYRGAANYDVILDTTPVIQSPVNMTAHDTPTPYKDFVSDGGNDGWQLFDGDAGTGPTINAPYPAIFSFAFGNDTAKRITRVKIKAMATPYEVQAPKDFKIQGSNDSTDGSNGTWTDLDTQTGITFTTGEQKTFDFVNATAYKWYRIRGTLDNNGGATYIQMAGVELHGPNTQATIQSVQALNLGAAITSAIVFIETTGGNPDEVAISTDNGSTWTVVATANIGKIIGVPSGAQIKLRVKLSGSVELESWGVAVA